MKEHQLDSIQVTCTACIRPKLLEITFSSFHDGLLSQFKHKELFINIDPIGDSGYDTEDILRICHKYFDKVQFNNPETGDFSKAVKWAWEQVTADYFLHLEDDWMLNKKISVEYLISTLLSNPKIASVRLNRQTSIKSKKLDWVSLNPILFKTSFIKDALHLYNEDLDPEKQFSIPPLLNHANNFIHLAYGDKKNSPYIEGAYVTDIGRYWRKSHGFDKSLKSGKFSWEIKSTNMIDHLKSWFFFKTLCIRKAINQLR